MIWNRHMTEGVKNAINISDVASKGVQGSKIATGLGLVPSLLGVGGALLGQVASRLFVKAQNRYNHPVQAMKRLKQAGLPLAAFNADNAGNQTSLPSEGFTQAGEHLSKFYEHRNERVAIARGLEDLRTASAGADVAEEDARIKLGKGENDQSLLADKQNTELAIQKATLKMSQNQGEIAAIDLAAKQELEKDGKLNAETYQRIAKMVKEMELIEQQRAFIKTQDDIMNAEKAAVNKIVDTMSKDGLSFMEAVLVYLMQRKSF